MHINEHKEQYREDRKINLPMQQKGKKERKKKKGYSIYRSSTSSTKSHPNNFLTLMRTLFMYFFLAIPKFRSLYILLRMIVFLYPFYFSNQTKPPTHFWLSIVSRMLAHTFTASNLDNAMVDFNLTNWIASFCGKCSANNAAREIIKRFSGELFRRRGAMHVYSYLFLDKVCVCVYEC